MPAMPWQIAETENRITALKSFAYRKKYHKFSVIVPALLLLSQVTWAASVDTALANFDITKTLLADLTGDGHDEKILVAGHKRNKGEAATLLVVNQQRILLEAPLALPKVENAYSPASFDGFWLEIVTASADTTAVVDIQGETTDILYSSTAGKKLVLRTVEEGNSSYNFNLQFAYDPQTQHLLLADILLTINGTGCERELESVYAVQSSPLLTTTLQAFNGREAFQSLTSLYYDYQTGKETLHKLMPQQVAANFERALAAYKANDKVALGQIMPNFIDYAEDECPAQDYIAAKYYFAHNPRWSNDLAFLFEQAGYYNEAVVLLQQVIRKHPDRAVAYLNLADSYWALNQKAEAGATYQQYQQLMHKQNRHKMPKRVAARIALSQDL